MKDSKYTREVVCHRHPEQVSWLRFGDRYYCYGCIEELLKKSGCSAEVITTPRKG